MILNEIFLASKISEKNNGNVNLSNYYTKSQTDGLISGKIDKEDGKGLSTNDFTDEYKSKVDSSAQQSTTYTKSETDQRITSKVAEIVANSPEDFDTLKEISNWIESHEDSAAAMNTAIVANTTAINNKVDKANGMGLSENNFTNEEKTKLSGLENYDDTEIKSNLAEVISALSGKADKVSGKGLSTNDFTNDDKIKLKNLENYDDANLKADVAETTEQTALVLQL
ncbi:MAG: hypothetical protein K2K89_05790 [Ruminococcus sp.]|nr:hypothetical protein [Ruminococcus sp.]